jgi:hypothetical protein
VCSHGEWNDRIFIETALSMLTVVSHFKKVMHRVADCFEALLAFTITVFNILRAVKRWDTGPRRLGGTCHGRVQLIGQN